MPENGRAGVDARIGIVGLGLIGGSIAAGLKSRGNGTVAAWDANPGALHQGQQAGIIDQAASSVEALVEASDLVVIAVPVRAMFDIASRIDFSRAVVTDVGSVKGQVIEAVIQAVGEVPPGFVPGHPVAGSERHGVAAADADLFTAHKVILTPLPQTDAAAVDQVAGLWQQLGADVVTMTPDHHDIVLAQTSHLPHLLAYALVDTLSQGGDSLEVFQYAAGGFRDFSRIAASDPVMWRDIFLSNPGPVLESLEHFSREIEALRSLIAAGDGEGLREVFARAKSARDYFSQLQNERQERRSRDD